LKIEYIFVYGTLKKEFNLPILKSLQKDLIFIGNGYVFGVLYLVKEYPGLILDNSKNSRVYGEVYKIKSQKVLDILDEYEECSSNFKKPYEYKRVKAKVHLEDKVLDCWIYEYNWSVENLKVIKSGEYKKFDS